jgi:hypothetical protein
VGEDDRPMVARGRWWRAGAWRLLLVLGGLVVAAVLAVRWLPHWNDSVRDVLETLSWLVALLTLASLLPAWALRQHGGLVAEVLESDPALFDTILADVGIQVVLSGVRIPRMNAIMNAGSRAAATNFLARTLIWNQRHPLHALREYEQFYSTHRPHQGIANARPLHALPPPITNQASIRYLDIRR